MAKPKLSDDSRTVTVRVPISIRKRGGRKLVITPDGSAARVTSSTRHVDSAMVKAIARAFRWRDMLESGQHATIREIAEVERINETYVGRVLYLTLLAPELVEAVLVGQQLVGLQLGSLMKRFPIAWKEQNGSLTRDDD
jgi:hypothetical protein